MRCEKKRTSGTGNRKEEATPVESVSKRHISRQVRCEHASQIRHNANEKSILKHKCKGRKGVTTYAKYFLLKKIKFRLVTFTLISEKPNNDL